MSRIGFLSSCMVCCMLVACIFATPAYSITPTFSSTGDPDGSLVGWFRFLTGSGTSAENYSNYHACTTPSYSQANFTEIDGTLNGDTGTPSWVTGSSSNPPSLLFTRANGHHVKIDENSTSCTTGNNPWRPTGDLSVTAWVKPPTVTCSDIGNKYTVVSKWNPSSSSCSYRLYLEAYDKNGASCAAASDVAFLTKLDINDTGSTFSCSTPCTVTDGSTVARAVQDDWTSIGFEYDDAGKIDVFKRGVTRGSNYTKCDDNTTIPSGSLNSGGNDLYIGTTYSGGTSDSFEGHITEIKVSHSLIQDLHHMVHLDHFDEDTSSTETFDDGAAGSYGVLKNGASFSDTIKHAGTSLSLDGTNDHLEYVNYKTVEDPENTTLLSPVTVEAWIYPTNVGSGDQTIISKWMFNDIATCTKHASSQFRLYLDSSGYVNFEINEIFGTVHSVTGTTALTNNKWYHVAGVLTNGSPDTLTADSIYAFVGGKADSSAVSVGNGAFDYLRGEIVGATSGAPLLVGATKISGTTACNAGSDTKDYFQGYIDETRANVWFYDGSTERAVEAFNPGFRINEVGFADSGQQNIELYVLPNLGYSIDLNNYTIKTCSKFATKYLVLSNSSASKVVESGDIITINLDGGSPPSEGTCQGGNTTCTYYSSNNGSSPLTSGDLAADDGILIFNRDNSSDTTMSSMGNFAPLVDAVFWGDPSAIASCIDIAANYNHGVWQDDSAMATGLQSDSGDSLCLRTDGDGTEGPSSWGQCNASIGSPNSSQSTAVDLLEFSAVTLSAGTLVTWVTGSEIDSFGFNVLRAEFPGEPFVAINDQIILATGSPTSGSDYSFLDENAEGKLYHYKLEEVELDGQKLYYGPIKATSALAGKVDSGSTTSPETSESSVGGSSNADSAATTPTAAIPSSENRRSSGCGQIVAKDGAASLFLFLLLILVIFLTTQSYRLVLVRNRSNRTTRRL